MNLDDFETMSGGEGEKAQDANSSDATSIDLKKPGDVVMVLRSIASRWQPSPEVRAAIVAQIISAIDCYQAKIDQAKAEGRDSSRLQSQLLKLVRLVVAMDAANVLDAHPELKTLAGMPRQRGPESRRPRHLRQAPSRTSAK